MASWASLFTPNPDTAVKDMDVVGDHCVLVARTPTNELSLIVVPLTHPKEAYAVQVSMMDVGRGRKSELAFSLDFSDILVLCTNLLLLFYYFLTLYPHIQASLLGLRHRNQKSRFVRPTYVRIPDFISST